MLFLWVLIVPLSTLCHVSGELDPMCVDNCKCCKDEKCGPRNAWTNVCSRGCIDGHRGESCYELCNYENCKRCGFEGFNTTCTACYDGYYLGPNKDCALSCPFNCKSCTSRTSCTECKKGYFGENCEKPCSQYCANNNCNKDTGKCIIGCTSGYSGDRCCIMSENCVECYTNIECKTCASGYFKKSCNETCLGGCHGSCDIFTGECIREGKLPNIAWLVGGSVVLTTVVLAVIFVSIFLLRRRRKQKDSSNDTCRIVNETLSSNNSDERVETIREGFVIANIKGRRCSEADYEDVVLDESDDQTQYYNFNSVSMNIKVADLSSYVTQDHFDFLKNEFKNLIKPVNLSKRCKIAKRTDHIVLNRYSGICPFDHSRVAIPGEPNFYINACYIDGYNKSNAYIASFGPTSKTTEKFKVFWQMVWYAQSDIIVMLTNLLEASVMKCEQYWPDEEKEVRYGHVRVKRRRVKEFAEYTIRSFTISKGRKQRHLTQIHFTAWPDKGVPSEVESLVEFRQRVKKAPVVLGGPVIVHCGAGVGRTGTYIALDILSEQGKAEGLVNVFDRVNKMRRQRVNMVHSADQYIFLYKALLYTLTFGCEAQTADEIKCLAFDVDDTFVKTFQTLNQKIDSEQDEYIAERDENKMKQYDIPGKRGRVLLNHQRKGGNHDYTNAVFVNSFKFKNLFITAETPMSDTVEDFLCMIYHQESPCVADLDDPLQMNKKYDVVEYIPKDNEEYTCGNFTVTSSKSETKPHYTVRKITIKNIEKGEEKIAYHFQYTKWGNGQKVADSPGYFVQFIKDVQKYVNKQVTDRPKVIVLCLNGCERSSLFCVVYTLLEKVEAERQVSVVNVIRRVRSQIKLSISSVEQLKFCYHCISSYLESDDTYLNYDI